MKRVKIMLSAILVMAIVAGALAFKVKTPGVCAYTATVATAPATTICNLIHATSTFVNTKTIETTASTRYAFTILKEDDEVPCPVTTAQCTQFLTLGAEN